MQCRGHGNIVALSDIGLMYTQIGLDTVKGYQLIGTCIVSKITVLYHFM